MATLREALARAQVPADIEPLGVAPFHIEFECHSWNSVSLLYAETDPIRIIKKPAPATGARSGFFFGRIEAGKLLFSATNIVEELRSGDSAIWCDHAAGTSQLTERGRLSAVCIQHEAFIAATRNLDDRPIRRIDPASPALPLLLSYMALLRRQAPTTDPLLAHRVSQHLIDLVAMTMEPLEAAQKTAATRTARLASIRADVLENLAHVRLSAKTVAARHSLSDRYIHILFEETGQTFSEFVEEERLKRAFTLLTDPSLGQQRISEIALQVGYVEHSTFTRAFRRRFGESPREVRRDALEGRRDTP
jgi:AraC-like DNA-binding protein